jgi:hypothetical protein
MRSKRLRQRSASASIASGEPETSSNSLSQGETPAGSDESTFVESDLDDRTARANASCRAPDFGSIANCGLDALGPGAAKQAGQAISDRCTSVLRCVGAGIGPDHFMLEPL